jgi:hypothetical protein
MTLRKLAVIAPVSLVLALAGPIAAAPAATPPSPGSAIPCYPFPFAFPSGLLGLHMPSTA